MPLGARPASTCSRGSVSSTRGQGLPSPAVHREAGCGETPAEPCLAAPGPTQAPSRAGGGRRPSPAQKPILSPPGGQTGPPTQRALRRCLPPLRGWRPAVLAVCCGLCEVRPHPRQADCSVSSAHQGGGTSKNHAVFCYQVFSCVLQRDRAIEICGMLLVRSRVSNIQVKHRSWSTQRGTAEQPYSPGGTACESAGPTPSNSPAALPVRQVWRPVCARQGACLGLCALNQPSGASSASAQQWGSPISISIFCSSGYT